MSRRKGSRRPQPAKSSPGRKPPKVPGAASSDPLVRALEDAVAYLRGLLEEGYDTASAVELTREQYPRITKRALLARLRATGVDDKPKTPRFYMPRASFSKAPAATPPSGWVTVATSVDTDLLRGDNVELSDMLRDLLARNGAERLVDDEGQLRRYLTVTGRWIPVDDSNLAQIVHGFSGRPIYAVDLQTGAIARTDDGENRVAAMLNISTATVNGTIAALRRECSYPQFFEGAAAGVAFKNGFARATADGVQLIPHSPDNRARHGFDYDYTEEEPQEWPALLEQAFAGDADLEQKASLIDEHFGISAMGLAWKYHRAAVYFGQGSNLKGIVADVAEEVFPQGSIGAVGPADDKYDYPRLAGKLLNIDRDVSAKALQDTGRLKKAIAGERIVVRDVSHRSFELKPIAGWLYCLNQFYAVTDKTIGFRRRHAIIQFNRQFDITEKDIAKRMAAAEGPRIVSRWLRAGARLMKRGGYDLPPSHDVLLAKWMGDADPCESFFEERVTPSDDKHLSPSEFYGAFLRWYAMQTELKGRRPPSAQEFGAAATKKFRKVKLHGKDVYKVAIAPGL